MYFVFSITLQILEEYSRTFPYHYILTVPWEVDALYNVDESTIHPEESNALNKKAQLVSSLVLCVIQDKE